MANSFRVEFVRKDGTKDSSLFGSKATAEKFARSVRNAVLSEVRIHSPVVQPVRVKEGTLAAQRKGDRSFSKLKKEPGLLVQFQLQEMPTPEQEATFFAECVEDGIPEWKAMQAMRLAKLDLKRRKSA